MKSFKEVYEMGTDEYTNHCKQMTPGQQSVDEGYESKVSQKLDKAGIDHTWKNGELRVSKRDVKSAEKILKRFAGPGLGTAAKMIPNIIGEDLEYDPKMELNESTEWKGGSKHVSLTRYSARGSGFGLQITQEKPMPGDKVRLKGAYVNLPVKDIPKLIKALQTVFKADPKTQLGDAED